MKKNNILKIKTTLMKINQERESEFTPAQHIKFYGAKLDETQLLCFTRFCLRTSADMLFKVERVIDDLGADLCL